MRGAACAPFLAARRGREAGLGLRAAEWAPRVKGFSPSGSLPAFQLVLLKSETKEALSHLSESNVG